MEPEEAPRAEAATLIPALRSLADACQISVHDITARRVEKAYYAEMHVSMDGSLSLAEAHARVDELEREARARVEQLAEIVTHIEPAGDAVEVYSVSRTSAKSLEESIKDLIKTEYGTAATHRLQIHPVGDSWTASLHFLLDGRMSLQEAHVQSAQLEAKLRDTIPRLSAVVVHTEPQDTKDGKT
jgi:divalent metal cation (Fe/Co/Zn/Cd) transporter